MPSATPSNPLITKFTNCRLVLGDELVEQDLWVSSLTGKILHSQKVFYGSQATPDIAIDLGGRIISPGLIDVQLNGAFGFNFSQIPDDASTYPKTLQEVNKLLVQTGVTSYLPTLTSEKQDVYHHALPHLGPSDTTRLSSSSGAESLGAHCEGPFLSPTKNGIHDVSNILSVTSGLSDLETCYGASNFPFIKMITGAPEVGNLMETIQSLVERGIVFSIGHTEATYEEASQAVAAGSTMITHLFNAMRPLHHRNPGVFGLLGSTSPASSPASSMPVTKPFFGLIADGIHLHPTSIAIAYNASPSTCILVTDAMHLVGLPDGVYPWTNGLNMMKHGSKLTLEGTDRIAGSSITLVECVNNFMNWSGATIPQALKTVTAAPAAMLGMSGVKGSLEADADADLVVLDDQIDGQGWRSLSVSQVWKFGSKVFDREE